MNLVYSLVRLTCFIQSAPLFELISCTRVEQQIFSFARVLVKSLRDSNDSTILDTVLDEIIVACQDVRDHSSDAALKASWDLIYREVTSEEIPKCSVESCNRVRGADGEGLLRCGRCQVVMYCSKSCQKS